MKGIPATHPTRAAHRMTLPAVEVLSILRGDRRARLAMGWSTEGPPTQRSLPSARAIATMSSGGVCGFLTNGNYDYFRRYVGISKVLSWDDDPLRKGEIKLRRGCEFVYGGNALCDKPGDTRFAEALLGLKKRYPGRVHLIMGDGDCSQLLSSTEPSYALRYLLECEAGHVYGSNLFVHGTVTTENMGKVAGEKRAAHSVSSWVEGLNSWAQEELSGYQAATNRSSDSASEGGGGRGLIELASRTGCLLSMAKPGAYEMDAKVEAFLKKSGIKCLVSGQFLDKECPTVVSGDAVRVISANLGSGDGGGVGEVLVNMAGACFVHGLLPDGSAYDYELVPAGVRGQAGDPYVGRRVEDQGFVKCKLSCATGSVGMYLIGGGGQAQSVALVEDIVAQKVEHAGSKSRRVTEGRVILAINLISVALFLAGAVWVICLYPMLSSRNYFSENALLVGSHQAAFSKQDALSALSFKKLLESHAEGARGASGAIHDAAVDIGFETVVRQWGGAGDTVVGLFRAPRGEGKECVVLSARYPDGDGGSTGGGASMGLLLSLLSSLSKTPWLSKDIIMVALPQSSPKHHVLDSFLHEYHGDVSNGSIPLPRGGDIWAALSLNIPDASFKRVSVDIAGDRGGLPNLDLVNVAVGHLNKANVQVSVSHSTGTPLAASFLPQELARATAKVHSLMANQARGVATGDHGAFKAYKIEALTFSGVPQGESQVSQAQVFQLGRAVEETIRSISNTLERFHQSFFLYLLTDDQRYVPVEKYLIPCGLLLVPLLLKAFVRHYEASCTPSGKPPPHSPRWPLTEYSIMGFGYGGGLLLLPLFLWASSAGRLLLGFVLSAAAFLCLVTSCAAAIKGRAGIVWEEIESQMLLVLLCGLSSAILCNFSLGAMISILLVPLYLVIVSCKRGPMRAVLALMASPPFSMLMVLLSGWMDHDTINAALSSTGNLPSILVCVVLIPANVLLLLSSIV